jgi:hypothetical protein
VGVTLPSGVKPAFPQLDPNVAVIAQIPVVGYADADDADIDLAGGSDNDNPIEAEHATAVGLQLWTVQKALKSLFGKIRQNEVECADALQFCLTLPTAVENLLPLDIRKSDEVGDWAGGTNHKKGRQTNRRKRHHTEERRAIAKRHRAQGLSNAESDGELELDDDTPSPTAPAIPRAHQPINNADGLDLGGNPSAPSSSAPATPPPPSASPLIMQDKSHVQPAASQPGVSSVFMGFYAPRPDVHLDGGNIAARTTGLISVFVRE